MGFIGGVIVLALFAVIVWRVLVAAAVGRDRFSQLAAAGVAALLMFHVFVNVGMTIGLMPVTGLPLPFLSAGGSAFIAMSVAPWHRSLIVDAEEPGTRRASAAVITLSWSTVRGGLA